VLVAATAMVSAATGFHQAIMISPSGVADTGPPKHSSP
jgi:hypothetical protein